MSVADTWVASSARCPHCAASSLRHFKAQAYDATPGMQVDVVECTACRFAWQFPLGRSTQQSAGVFDAAYNAASDKRGTYFDPERRAQVTRLELGYGSRLAIPGRRMLDVGGGDGVMAVVAAQDGSPVTAVDPAVDPATQLEATGWRDSEQHAATSSRKPIGTVSRAPRATARLLARFSQLRKAARWPQRSLEIFCLATQRAG